MFPETGFNTIKPVNSSNFLSSNRRRDVSNIRVPKRKQIICHNMSLFAAVKFHRVKLTGKRLIPNRDNRKTL